MRVRVDWATPSGDLLAIEPTRDELEAHAPALAAAWSDPHNAALMGHTEPFEAAEVVEQYAAMQAAGARVFLLLRDGLLVGDADFRGLDQGTAEFAFMVAAPASQGKGLGTQFALMLHHFAFSKWGLQRSYASVDPANAASRRVFEKLGFRVDASPGARRFADEPRDVVMSVDRAAFERGQVVLPEIRVGVR